MITFFEHLVNNFPVAMAVRMLFEHVYSRDVINGIFEQNAQEQYPRCEFFADIVECMGGVVGRVHRSLHAAYRHSLLKGVISLSNFYYRVNGVEPRVCAALVRETAQRLMEVLDKLQAPRPPLVPGYATRIVDGNAIGATDHRLEVLRETRSGPLPGKTLVIFDYERDIVRDMICCEDGHAQERSLFDELLQFVCALELWIADRNFATCKFLVGISERSAFFIVRRHGNLPLVENGPMRVVFQEGKEVIRECPVSITYEGKTISARFIKISLEKPTRDGDKELEIVTTLPATVSAKIIADVYGDRWTIETTFSTLTTVLKCELPSLGRPRAALFTFTMAVIASNIISGMRSAIRAIHGVKAEENVSVYHLVNDLQGTARSTDLAECTDKNTVKSPDYTAANGPAYSLPVQDTESANTEVCMLDPFIEERQSNETLPSVVDTFFPEVSTNESSIEASSCEIVSIEEVNQQSLNNFQETTCSTDLAKCAKDDLIKIATSSTTNALAYSLPMQDTERDQAEASMLDPLIEKRQPNKISSIVLDTFSADLSMNKSCTAASQLVNIRSDENQNGGHFWHSYASMSADEFTPKLLDVVARIDLSRYKKAKTRPRSAPRVRGSPSDPPHVSTYRLLKEQRLKLQKPT